MTCKTGQMSIRQSVRPSVRPSGHPCGVNIFKTLRLPDRWTEVDETWHVLWMAGQNFYEAELWISAFAPRGSSQNFGRSTETIHSELSAFYVLYIVKIGWHLRKWQLKQHIWHESNFNWHHFQNLRMTCSGHCTAANMIFPAPESRKIRSI